MLCRVSKPLHNNKNSFKIVLRIFKNKYNFPKSFYATPLHSASKDCLSPKPGRGKEPGSVRLDTLCTQKVAEPVDYNFQRATRSGAWADWLLEHRPPLLPSEVTPGWSGVQC